MQFNFAPVRSPLGSWPSLATGEALNQVGRQSGLRGEQERYSARHPNRAFERNFYLDTPLWRDSKNNNANQDVSPISKLFSILHSWILISSKRTCIALRNYTRIIHLISQGKEGDMQTGRTTELDMRRPSLHSIVLPKSPTKEGGRRERTNNESAAAARSRGSAKRLRSFQLPLLFCSLIAKRAAAKVPAPACDMTTTH